MERRLVTLLLFQAVLDTCADLKSMHRVHSKCCEIQNIHVDYNECLERPVHFSSSNAGRELVESYCMEIWNGVLGKKHFVNKRGLIELYGTLKCGTSRFPLAYVSYGCYCGPGGSGWPMDETDWCCHRHDCCYDFAQRQGCHPITDRYKWTCQDNTVICDAVLDRCQNIICQCDKEAAQCWRFAPFNLRYVFWQKYHCGQIYPPCGYKH